MNIFNHWKMRFKGYRRQRDERKIVKVPKKEQI